MTTSPPTIYRLRVTAELDRGRYVILANDDTPVSLPHGRFEALVKLLVCLATKPRGYTYSQDFALDAAALHKVIERLRKDFDAVLGVRAGKALIAWVGRRRTTYKLLLPAEAIEVDADLSALAPHHISHSDVDVLLRSFRIRQPSVGLLSAPVFYDTTNRAKPPASQPQTTGRDAQSVNQESTNPSDTGRRSRL